MRTIFGPRFKKTTPFYSRDKSKRLTDHRDVLSRWAEHFSEVLSPTGYSANFTYINSLPTLPSPQQLDDPPSFEEFSAAVNRLKNGKAAGSDSLPAELYKYGRPSVQNRLFELVLRI